MERKSNIDHFIDQFKRQRNDAQDRAAIAEGNHQFVAQEYGVLKETLDAKEAEIATLKARIDELEGKPSVEGVGAKPEELESDFVKPKVKKKDSPPDIVMAS